MSVTLAPKISQQIFAQRRQTLLEKLPDNSLVILATAHQKQRNADADYKYRPDSSFFYLTGFAEPDAILLLEKTDNKNKYILFVRPKDKLREIWDGKRVGIEGAKVDFYADEAFDISQANELIPQYLLGKKQVFSRFQTVIIEWLQKTKTLKRGEGVPNNIVNLDKILDEMRLIKDCHEIELLKTACAISAEGHKKAMTTVRPNMYEYQLEAEINYTFAQYGCVPSYNSIVAGGDNANILHYVENNQQLAENDLVLIDAGAEYEYYAGDISRTFPVSGKFNEAQKQIYNIVLEANLQAIASLQVGKSCRIHHETAVSVLTAGLVKLGILSGDVETLVQEQAYLPFFMHGTGHWLGMDVHDVGSYVKNGLNHDKSLSESRLLQAGMVLTVEPALYFAHDNELVPPKYRGIGIRIEDDVLITEAGAVVLTSQVPKTIEEIENLMAKKS